ncbi:MAG: hypothetical protein IT178_02155 [Acidobacteria bacterium]|nr:hypothetical protein [Acidobacteriota bacterium]
MTEDTQDSPPAVVCPDCGAALDLVDSEISSGAFRPQAASMPQRRIYFFDCAACRTCWKFGTKLLPDPVRQILRS